MEPREGPTSGSILACAGQRFPFRFVQALAGAFTTRYDLYSKDCVYFIPLSLEEKSLSGWKTKRRKEKSFFSQMWNRKCRRPNSAFDLFFIYLRKWFRLIFPENLTAFHNTLGGRYWWETKTRPRNMKTDLVNGNAGVWTPIFMTKNKQEKKPVHFPRKHNAVFFLQVIGAQRNPHLASGTVTLDIWALSTMNS